MESWQWKYERYNCGIHSTFCPINYDRCERVAGNEISSSSQKAYLEHYGKCSIPRPLAVI